jgi:hypothetical protein
MHEWTRNPVTSDQNYSYLNTIWHHFKVWKILIHDLRKPKQIFNKNMTPSGGPWKGPTFSYFTPYSISLSVEYMKAPYWSGSFFPHTFSLIGPFPSVFLPQTLYRPSTSHRFNFSPEDGYTMFLRNAGSELQNHMVPKTKTTRTQ